MGMQGNRIEYFFSFLQFKLAAVKIEKVLLKLAKGLLVVAKVPFYLAKAVLKGVELVVQVGIDVVDGLLKAASNILQIHSFCISATLGKGEGLCLGFNCSMSLFGEKIDFDGNFCINGNGADNIGECGFS